MLSYYFVKTDCNDAEIAQFETAMEEVGFVPNRIIQNIFCYQAPRVVYLRAIGIQGAPSIVGIDTTDDTKIGETLDPSTIVEFKAATDAAYAEKYAQ